MANNKTSLNVFLSYSWNDKKTADQIDRDLVQMQINVLRDVRDLKYKERISNFMTQIRTTDFAILLISDFYLKSKNCMTEVLNLLREREYEKKILPVITGDAQIYETKSRLEYTDYWRSKKQELEDEISRFSPTSAISAIHD